MMIHGAGRPKIHPDDASIRRLAIVCTDEEWEELLTELEPDTNDRYMQIYLAITSNDGQWLKQKNELLRLSKRLLNALDNHKELKAHATELLAKYNAVTGVTPTQEDSDSG